MNGKNIMCNPYIANTVIILFLRQNLHHHFRSLGGWTFAFKPYRDENIPMHLDDPNMTKMGDIIDPYCKSICLLSVTNKGFFSRIFKSRVIEIALINPTD